MNSPIGPEYHVSLERVEQTTREPVSVVIVNYRTLMLTSLSVESTLNEPEVGEIIVVDSGSRNGDFETMQSRFAKEPRVRLVQSVENVGFGRAANLGVENANFPFVFLLNSDAIVRPGCLRILQERWSNLTAPGVLAPEIYVGSSNDLQPEVGGEFPTVMKLITRRTKRYSAGESPDWVTGCAMLFRRDVFIQLGGFDPDIFMYYEDVLLCWTLRQAGLNVFRCEGAAVEHLGSQSTTTRSSGSTRWYKSQEIALRKMGQPTAALCILKVVRCLRRNH